MPQVGSSQKLPNKWEKRELLREKGQFWTPSWVAKAMVSYVLQSGTKELFDPAAGRGAFLHALEELGATETGVRFYGTDIDPQLLADPTFKRPYCEVEIRDFIIDPPIRLFRAIVANPPYIRHHRLSHGIKRKLQEISHKNIGLGIDGRAGVHVFFLMQALSLLAPEGRLSFIMPADTCEGVFAHRLWRWIANKYCLEAVISFEPDATPFPNVDTNALVFMIKNSDPVPEISWVRCKKGNAIDILAFTQSRFLRTNFPTLDIERRSLDEALNTGLSRASCKIRSRFTLSHFAHVMRGIATGANDYFCLTTEKAKEIGIPNSMLKRTIGRTRDVQGDTLKKGDLESLDNSGRPTLLFSPDGRSMEEFPPSVREYLKLGQQLGINRRALIKTRNPWYKMEIREVPPFLFAYLGRRSSRFIRNEAGAVPLTGFLCVYPHSHFANKAEEVWKIRSARETLKNLHLVAKSYGSGALKVEPRNLERLPIPEHLCSELSDAYARVDRRRQLFLLESPSIYGNEGKRQTKLQSAKKRESSR